MKKKCANSTIDMLNKSRGLNREKYIRPRSAVFADKTKYNRKAFKKVEME